MLRVFGVAVNQFPRNNGGVTCLLRPQIFQAAGKLTLSNVSPQKEKPKSYGLCINCMVVALRCLVDHVARCNICKLYTKILCKYLDFLYKCPLQHSFFYFFGMLFMLHQYTFNIFK